MSSQYNVAQAPGVPLQASKPNKPNRDVAIMYKVIADYYENPVFTKIENRDSFSVYMCKLKTLLNIHQYLIAFVDIDVFFKGQEQRLSALNWTTFQTRSLKENYNIKPFVHTPKKGGVYNTVITRVHKDAEQSVYDSRELPVIITLLVDTQNMYEYPDKGALNSSLETFNTVLTFK
jgi:hypothetical protein